MAIKSHREDSLQPVALDYPTLMLSKVSGIVVLFTSGKVGTVVHVTPKAAGYILGEQPKNFIPATCSDTWELFKGTITLSNT